MDEQQVPQPTQKPSRLSQVGIVRIVFGLALIGIKLFSAGFGFSGVSSDPLGPNNSAQVAGFNGMTIIMYALGVWLVYSGIRKGYRRKTTQA